MFTINGKEFYTALAKDRLLKPLMDQLGVTTFQGYITPRHTIAMKRILRELASVEVLWKGLMKGKQMDWVRVRLV
jgi:hypothetical protein